MRISFTTHIVTLCVGVGDIGVEIEPILRCPIRLQTRSDAFEVCVVHHTDIVQIAHGEIDVAIVVAFGYGEVILLTQ